MRRYLLALVLFASTEAAARADYLFMQYMMKFRKPQQGPTAPTPLQPGTQTPDTEENTITLYVNGVVEGDFKVLQNPLTARVKATYKHKWGLTNLYNDDQVATAVKKYPSVRARFQAKLESIGKNRTNEKVYDLAEWCLNYGLLDEFAKVMDDLAKAGKPTGLDKLDRAVECYTKAKAELAKRIDREDASTLWRGKLGFRMSQSDHYSILYNAQLADPPEVDRRLKLLEENMKGVYYWFAFRGFVLPMPDQKLVTVLLDQPDQFKVQRALIEDEALVTDGFFSTRDGVVVFSAQRLDDASVLFGRQMQGAYSQGWDRSTLLKGTSASKVAGKSIDEQYRMQTLALLDAALEEEGERAAVSHEGTRQIFVACGMQKPTVIMPDYLQFGMASVFDTPKGPYPFAPVEVRVPYWHGWGAPSWEYTRIFKNIEQGGLMHDLPTPVRSATDITQASQILRNVITDSDFSRARDLGPRAGARHLIVARTYAWGLCYYLCKARMSGVMKLYEELGKQPRDLELEPTELLACFCRAFDLADTTGLRPDPVKFETFAKDWLGFMRTINTPGTDIKLGLEGPSIPVGGGAPGGNDPSGKSGGGGGQPKGKGKGKG